MTVRQFGDATLYLGDARAILPTLAPVDLVLTDPPYRTISGGRNSDIGTGFRDSVLADNDGRIFRHNDIEPEEILPLLYSALRDGSQAYVMTNNLQLRAMLNAAHAAGFRFHNLLAWQKNTATANRWFMKELELVLFFYRPPAKAINDPSAKQIARAPNPRGKVHPTEKPVELMRFYVDQSTQPGEVVLDPFMGSGSTGVAAINAGRKFIGVEMDPEHFETASRRVQEAVERGGDGRRVERRSKAPSATQGRLGI